jgi:signal transduction histidine kinase
MGRLPGLTVLWPLIDVALITATLVLLRSPSDALFALYFIPLASAVASLRTQHVAGVTAAAALGYLLVVHISSELWSVQTIFRVVIIGVMASLYGWIVRTVGLYERAAERAEFQTQLAREIHDGVQHLLVTLGLRLELATRLLREAPDRVSDIIAAERDTARRATDELRYLVRRLRGTPYADLATALRTQVAAQAERWPFELDIVAAPQLPRLTPAAEHAVVRVIQECLTNVARHAHAHHAEVRVEAANGTLQCTVRDDGTGFDPARIDDGGLAGLRDRVAAAGGVLAIHSRPGGGTTITATFPVTKAPRWQQPAS